MDKAWLIRRVTVEEAEAASLAEIDWLRAQGISVSKPRVPFRAQSAEWQALKDVMRDGDELWQFSSPEKTWERLMGRGGFVVLRDGEVIGKIVTIFN